MSLRYAAILAPACAFTHPQQPRRIVVRRDYSSIDDVFDSVFGDPWSPFGLSRRDPWGMRRRSPLAQQFGQLKRLSQAFEEQLQRVDEDDFLADTPLGQRRQLETPKEDAPKTDDSTSSLYEAPKAEGDEAVAPAAPRGYAYSWSSSSVTQNGETRTTVRKNFNASRQRWSEWLRWGLCQIGFLANPTSFRYGRVERALLARRTGQSQFIKQGIGGEHRALPPTATTLAARAHEWNRGGSRGLSRLAARMRCGEIITRSRRA